MISLTCRVCGGDLAAADDAFCVHCGSPVDDRRDAPDHDPDHQPLLSKNMVTAGAAIVAVIAIGAIAATMLASLFHTPEPGPTISGPAAPTTTIATPVVVGSTTVWPLTRISDEPVVNSHTITEPVIDDLVRYIIGGEALTFRIDGDHCGRGSGTIGASGVIRNYSLAQQTFDYVLHVELIRVWNRARIGHLEATIEDLGPFEAAEWSVEMVSSRVATFDCKITDVTVIPSA